MKHILVITLFIPLFSFSSDTDLKITPVLENDQTIRLSIEKTSEHSSKKDKKSPVVVDPQLLVVSGLIKDRNSNLLESDCAFSFLDRALKDNYEKVFRK